MGLLIVQILNAVLQPAQENVGPSQRVGGLARHQAGMGQSGQRVTGGPGPELRKLPAAHNLQQLHGELNLANAPARHLHIVGPFGVARAAPGGMFANLPVQNTQGVENRVIQIAPEYKR